jgi:predicted small lipoprotein YifL
MNTLSRALLVLLLTVNLAACGTNVMGPGNSPDPGQNSPDPGQNSPDPGQNSPDPGQNSPDPGQ